MSIAEDDGPEAIQTLLARSIDAWKHGDADEYASVFTEDCRYIAFFGGVYRGRREVAESHRVLFTGPLKKTELFVERLELRFLRKDVALLITRGDVGRKPPRKFGKVQSYVAVRDNDRWLFSHFQNTKRLGLARFLAYRAGAGTVPSLDW
ncbi:SgcJ/EcaC family oxidoreductase [Brevundimonas sp.]|uniref:SgcJ/EcaC family oxidoreductase n=1 Tax=Brevundimonas sp. TaxID=1871086 RepID=UPI001815FD48|nr:SgcJ/EcaC family oxidoreductase [Brevundimonas sp.]MBA4806427.1 SgcJ/EcaC family oxidoreductase [Brevundimonas sp.]